jgi:phage internal scaffolding protein
MSRFRSAYGDKLKVGKSFLDEDGKFVEGRTKQSFKGLTDINTIIRQYDRTGLINHVNQAAAQYGDFSAVNEYQESLNLVLNAQGAFMELPSAIRKRFGNDPGAFFEFATDPSNLEEMVRLGLARAPVSEQVPVDAPEGA